MIEIIGFWIMVTILTVGLLLIPYLLISWGASNYVGYLHDKIVGYGSRSAKERAWEWITRPLAIVRGNYDKEGFIVGACILSFITWAFISMHCVTTERHVVPSAEWVIAESAHLMNKWDFVKTHEDAIKAMDFFEDGTVLESNLSMYGYWDGMLKSISQISTYWATYISWPLGLALFLLLGNKIIIRVGRKVNKIWTVVNK